jgi:nitrate/nitrite transporter NarK
MKETQTMNATHTGLLAGLVLGAAGTIGGFGAFLVTLLVGVLGMIIGRAVDGQLDLTALSGLLGRGRDR